MHNPKLKSVKSTLLSFITLFLGFTVCISPSNAAQPDASRFLWFEYQGSDEIFEAPLPKGMYQNPILAGFYPDPSIIRVDDTFYMVNSSFAYFPGIPISKSTDLINWQSLGYVLTRPSQFLMREGNSSRGIFAPTIRYHKGTFYVITTGVDGAGNNFMVTASNPEGPWSDPIFLPEVDGIDPSIFFDDDGKVYITHNGPPNEEPRYEGHRAIWMWQYDPEKKSIVPQSGRVIVNGGVDISKEPIWIEGPHIFKVNGWYYLICAEGGTADQHSEVVFRTRDLKSPFIPYSKNPILTQRDLPANRKNPVATAGHADFAQTPDGDWWAVFLATRNYDQNFFNTGRETFLLPVQWKDEWPVILEQGKPIPYRATAPKGLKPTAKADKLNGNFTWRDNFDKAELNTAWNLLRYSENKIYSIHPKGGLILHPNKEGLNSMKQPAFVGRRQQHLSFKAQTVLELPTSTSTISGITAFQNEKSYFFSGIERKADGIQVSLIAADQSDPKPLASFKLETKEERIHLKVEANKSQIEFFYKLASDKKWKSIAGILDNKVLSTQRAGGFVGTYIALHSAYTSPANPDSDKTLKQN